ncbi:ABC transporter permease [Azospirillum doebereinerae]
MLVFMLKRLGQTLLTLMVLTFIIFTLARMTGDPTPLVMPSEATDEDRQFFREQYGLDRNLAVQYVIFLNNAAHGDFGVSFRFRTPAFDIVREAVGPTLKLAFSAMLLAILIGVPLGCLAAARRNGWIDRFTSLFASLGQATPTFWVGLMLIVLLAIDFPLFPSSGYGTLAHYALPTLTLGFYAASSIARLTRANMVEALKSDFVHMERVLGLSSASIVLKHALRNASLPIVTYLGLQFGLLLGGAVVTERVFAWPGIGQTIVDAILYRDYPVAQAAILTTAILFLAVNLAVDLIVMALDPRMRDA